MGVIFYSVPLDFFEVGERKKGGSRKHKLHSNLGPVP